jgi:hypothetical protein
VGRDESNTIDGAGRGGGVLVDPERLRSEVRAKYREVAAHPGATHHFHTGRALAALLDYPAEVVAGLPDQAVESFAGVGNPLSLRELQPGERVLDIGSGRRRGHDAGDAQEGAGEATASSYRSRSSRVQPRTLY